MKKAFLVGLFLLFATTCTAADFALAVKEVKYYPESERIVAEIVNQSDQAINTFSADFFVDGELRDTFSREQARIDPDGVYFAYMKFPDDGETHAFHVEITHETVSETGGQNQGNGTEEPPANTGEEPVETVLNTTELMLIAMPIFVILILVTYLALKIRKRD